MSAGCRVIIGGRAIAGRIQQYSGETSWSADVSHLDVKAALIGAEEQLKDGSKV